MEGNHSFKRTILPICEVKYNKKKTENRSKSPNLTVSFSSIFAIQVSQVFNIQVHSSIGGHPDILHINYNCPTEPWESKIHDIKLYKQQITILHFPFSYFSPAINKMVSITQACKFDTFVKFLPIHLLISNYNNFWS